MVHNLRKARAYQLNFDVSQKHNMGITIHLIEVLIEWWDPHVASHSLCWDIDTFIWIAFFGQLHSTGFNYKSL